MQKCLRKWILCRNFNWVAFNDLHDDRHHDIQAKWVYVASKSAMGRQWLWYYNTDSGIYPGCVLVAG